MTDPLTGRTLLVAVRRLSASDANLAVSVARFGPPPLWAREPGFSSLVAVILEQQVSLASARATFGRLISALGTVSPTAVLGRGEADLRAIGLTRQKAGYIRELAGSMEDGFDLAGLAAWPDDEVRARLTGLRGVGRWTADVYITMCLLRPDVWPWGDQALVAAATEVTGLRDRPTFDRLEALAERWRPHRAVAARILWHHYLRVRGMAVD